MMKKEITEKCIWDYKSIADGEEGEYFNFMEELFKKHTPIAPKDKVLGIQILERLKTLNAQRKHPLNVEFLIALIKAYDFDEGAIMAAFNVLP